MPHRPTFPNGYTKEELAAEIVRLHRVVERQRVFFECMAALADKVERTTTDSARLKALDCLLELAHCAVQSCLESAPDLRAIA